jgi:hypothetical protein
VNETRTVWVWAKLNGLKRCPQSGIGAQVSLRLPYRSSGDTLTDERCLFKNRENHSMRIGALTLLGLMPFLWGCERQSNVTRGTRESLTGQIGRPCTVQFRREILGVAKDNAIPPTAAEYKGADLQIKGTLAALDADYLILRQNQAVVWIPESSILLVRFDE